MEELLKNISSVQALVVVVGLHLVNNVGKFVYGILKKDNAASEETNKALVAEVSKLRSDLRRFYWAIKLLSGDRWEEVSKQIQEDKDFL